MSVQRAGDLARFELHRVFQEQTAKKFDTAQMQATTGIKAQTFSNSASTLTEIFNLQTTQSSISQYQSDITKTQGRLKMVEGSLTTILGVMQEFRSRLGGVLNAASTDASFPQFCADSLDSIAQALNAQDIERNNVFGGTSWSGPVVDLNRLPTPGLGGAVSTAYYTGDDGQLSVHINDNKYLDYTFRADDPSIAQVLHALKIGATATPSSDVTATDMQRLAQALDTINQATTDVSNMFARVGNAQKALEVESNTLSNLGQTLDEMEVDLTQVNVVEAWMQCSLLRGQMEMQIANATQNLQLTKTMMSDFM